jgi:hypothetical protein
MAEGLSIQEKSKFYPFTCNTCQVAFRSHDAQKVHYHTDWQYVTLRGFILLVEFAFQKRCISTNF